MGRAYVSNILSGRVREELTSWAGTRRKGGETGGTGGTGGGEVGDGERGGGRWGEAFGSGGQARTAAVRLTPFFQDQLQPRGTPFPNPPCPRRILTEMPGWPSLRGGIISAILFRGLIRNIKPKQDPT